MNDTMLTRRYFLTGSAAMISARRFRDRAQTTPVGHAGPASKLVLLGTGGGPSPKRLRSAPAHVLVVEGHAYVIDCGDGVARQMVLAGVELSTLRAVFLTHHHSDHNADYGNLLLLGWAAGLQTPVDAYGPPPLVTMTRLFLEMNSYDIATRTADEGRPPLAPLIAPHELVAGGAVMQDARVKVTAALVKHPPVTPAFAYRFDTADRSIVFSGDTARSDTLIALAKDADVLVHEVMYLPGLDRLVANNRNARTLRGHLLASHTASEDVGLVAAAAGVKTLVLSHFVPGDDPSITDEMWIEGVRAHYRGAIVVGKDLMSI